MAITTQEVFVGDDWNIPLTLGKVDENEVFTALTIDLASTVNASLIAKDGTILIASTAQSNATTGADWTNGVVAVVFTNVQTASLSPSVQAFIEIEITDTGSLKDTYQTEPDILIKRSYIT